MEFHEIIHRIVVGSTVHAQLDGERIPTLVENGLQGRGDIEFVRHPDREVTGINLPGRVAG